MRAQRDRRRRGLGRLWSALLALLAAAALLPLAGLGARLVGSGMPPFPVDGDHALIEIATRQAAAGERLLGPYSRFGFHHPGPGLFYLFAPFFSAARGSYLALCLAVVSLNLCALAVVLGVLKRSDPGSSLGLAWPCLVLAGYLLFLEPGVLVSPWNPHAILLPLLAALVTAAAVMEGRDAWLPAAAAFATVALESHLGLLPVLAGAAAVVMVVRLRRSLSAAQPSGRGSVAAYAAAAAVAVLGWLPVGLDAALHRGGNLAAIASFLVHRPGGQPLPQAARAVLAQVGAPLLAPWGATARAVPDGVATWLGLALVLASGAALAAAVLRRRSLGAALAGLELVAVASAVLAAASVVGPVHGYLLRWVTTLAPLGLLAIGETVRSEWMRGPFPRLLSIALAAGLAAAAVAGWRATLTWNDVERLLTSQAFARNRTLAAAAVSEAQRTGATGVTLTPIESGQWGPAAGVAARLLAARQPVAVGARWGDMFGLARSPQPDDLRLGVTASDEAIPGTLVASAGGIKLVRLEPEALAGGELDLGRAAAVSYILDGFDAAEDGPQDGFRWMVGRSGRILIPLAGSHHAAVVALEIAPLVVTGRPQTVAVSIDGQPAGTANLDRERFAWYRFALPDGRPDRVAVLELTAAWAASPFQLERSLDVRPLSLRVRRISLEPAADPARAPARHAE